ncbi:MAG TPA: GNAT family N-acetyltransferase [Casimicrobiaceae bacterium]
MVVDNDTAHHRFLVRLPEGEGELVYHRLAPHTLELVHTGVDPNLRGRGVAEALAETAIAYARGHAMRIVATCPYVQRWLAKHPEHNDLVVARA